MTSKPNTPRMTYSDVAEELIGELDMFKKQVKDASKNTLARVLIASMEYPLANSQYKEESKYTDDEIALLNAAVALKEKFGVLHVLALAEQQQDELNNKIGETIA